MSHLRADGAASSVAAGPMAQSVLFCAISKGWEVSNLDVFFLFRQCFVIVFKIFSGPSAHLSFFSTRFLNTGLDPREHV